MFSETLFYVISSTCIVGNLILCCPSEDGPLASPGGLPGFPSPRDPKSRLSLFRLWFLSPSDRRFSWGQWRVVVTPRRRTLPKILLVRMMKNPRPHKKGRERKMVLFHILSLLQRTTQNSSLTLNGETPVRRSPPRARKGSTQEPPPT